MTHGTHSPFSALHESGSFRGFICRVLAVAGPVVRDPTLTFQVKPALGRSRATADSVHDAVNQHLHGSSVAIRKAQLMRII